MNTIQKNSCTEFNIKEYDTTKSYNKELSKDEIVKRILDLQQVCLNLVQKLYNATVNKNGNLRYYDVVSDRTSTLSNINTAHENINWIFEKINNYTIEILDNGYILFTHKKYPTLSNSKYHFYLHQNDIRQPYSTHLRELRKQIYIDKQRSREIHYTIYGDKEIHQLEDRLQLLKKIKEEYIIKKNSN